MEHNNYKNLFISIGIAELTGLISGILAGNSSDIYRSLTTPPLSPPGWVFPIVWMILYALMGAAAWIVYSAPFTDATKEQKKTALQFYAAQLFFNFLWSIIFFRFSRYGLALLVLAILLILLLITIYQFHKISKTAAWLLLPYLLWSLFAFYLNAAIYLLN